MFKEHEAAQKQPLTCSVSSQGAEGKLGAPASRWGTHWPANHRARVLKSTITSSDVSRDERSSSAGQNPWSAVQEEVVMGPLLGPADTTTTCSSAIPSQPRPSHAPIGIMGYSQQQGCTTACSSADRSMPCAGVPDPKLTVRCPLSPETPCCAQYLFSLQRAGCSQVVRRDQRPLN